MIDVYSNTASEWLKLKKNLYKRELYSKNTPNYIIRGGSIPGTLFQDTDMD